MCGVCLFVQQCTMTIWLYVPDLPASATSSCKSQFPPVFDQREWKSGNRQSRHLEIIQMGEDRRDWKLCNDLGYSLKSNNP